LRTTIDDTEALLLEGTGFNHSGRLSTVSGPLFKHAPHYRKSSGARLSSHHHRPALACGPRRSGVVLVPTLTVADLPSSICTTPVHLTLPGTHQLIITSPVDMIDVDLPFSSVKVAHVRSESNIPGCWDACTVGDHDESDLLSLPLLWAVITSSSNNHGASQSIL